MPHRPSGSVSRGASELRFQCCLPSVDHNAGWIGHQWESPAAGHKSHGRDVRYQKISDAARTAARAQHGRKGVATNGRFRDQRKSERGLSLSVPHPGGMLIATTRGSDPRDEKHPSFAIENCAGVSGIRPNSVRNSSVLARLARGWLAKRDSSALLLVDGYRLRSREFG